MMIYLQTKFKYLLLLGIFILPSVSLAYDPSIQSGSVSQDIFANHANIDLSSYTGLNNKTITAISMQVIDTNTGNATISYNFSGTCSGSISGNITGATSWTIETITGSVNITDITGCILTFGGQNTTYYKNPFTFYGIEYTSIPYNPSLFGTMTTNPTSLLNDIGEITRQHMWGSVIGWIILSLGIYTGFWLALSLISMLGTAFRNDRERTARINKLADNAIAEAEAFDRKHPRS